MSTITGGRLIGVATAIRRDQPHAKESEQAAVEEQMKVEGVVARELLVEDGSAEDGEERERNVVAWDHLRVAEKLHPLRDSARTLQLPPLAPTRSQCKGSSTRGYDTQASSKDRADKW